MSKKKIKSTRQKKENFGKKRAAPSSLRKDGKLGQKIGMEKTAGEPTR